MCTKEVAVFSSHRTQATIETQLPVCLAHSHNHKTFLMQDKNKMFAFTQILPQTYCKTSIDTLVSEKHTRTPLNM